MSSPRRRRRRRPIPRKPASSGGKPRTPKAVPAKPAAAPTPVDTDVGVKEIATPPAAKKPAAQKDPYIGKTVGRCRIEERIGRGKTAAVYRAHYEALDDSVAIKILTPHACRLPELVERFDTEAKVIARLDNENVVKVYDVGSEGDMHFMVMELLDGFSVLDLIQREGQVDPMDALRVVRQAAHGLAAAHAQGIVHRDIKPQNLLLLEDGTVKVLDFGLAAQFDETSERVGTPHYMAPEVCADGTADLGSDVYALGIVLYHLLVGQPPYAGKDIKGILRAHIEGKPLRPERDRPGLSKEVGELVRTLTKADPLTRPTASEVVTMLDAIGGEELQEKSTLRRRRSSRARARVEARKKSPVGPAVAGIAVVVGILIAIAAMGSGDDDGGGASTGPDEPTPTPVATTPGRSPSDPNPVIPVEPAETEAERLERERQEAEAAKKAEEDKKEKDALRALGVVETWARDNWNGAEDTKAVIDKYQSVYSRYKGTEAAATARERLRGIKARTIHPHPDRSWSDAMSVAEAREEWRTVKPEIDTLISAHKYRDALQKLPERVNDADGQLSRELHFHATLLGHLQSFQSGLVKHAKTMDDADRRIQTPDGEGSARIVTRNEMKVGMPTGLETYKWEQLKPAEILKLARAAFTDKGTQFYLYQLAYAYAHRLQDAFWDLQLDLSGASDIAQYQRMVSDYESRFEDRMKGK